MSDKRCKFLKAGAYRVYRVDSYSNSCNFYSTFRYSYRYYSFSYFFVTNLLKTLLDW